jgi:hypothetical protein
LSTILDMATTAPRSVSSSLAYSTRTIAILGFPSVGAPQ